jgi:hypothetical protein
MGWWRRALQGGFAAIGTALSARIVPLVMHGGEIDRGIEALTTEAQRQIGLQYDTGSAQDVKTIGMIAAAAAGAALFIPTQHQLSGLWVIPLFLLAVGIYCFVESLLGRDFERGPQVPDLYRNFGGTVIEAKESILQELVRAIEHNEPLLLQKTRWFKRGLMWLAFAIYATALVLITVTFLPV